MKAISEEAIEVELPYAYLSHHDVKACGEWRYGSTYSYVRYGVDMRVATLML
jgi:hypothetical protein